MASKAFHQASRRSRPKHPQAPRRQAAIPGELQVALQQRLERHFRSEWSKAGIDIVVRYRGRFAYIGYLERRRGEPESGALPLFRLEYTGDPQRWVFALFTYSHEDYELCAGPTGSFTPTPEQAFDCAARLYLT